MGAPHDAEAQRRAARPPVGPSTLMAPPSFAIPTRVQFLRARGGAARCAEARLAPEPLIGLSGRRLVAQGFAAQGPKSQGPLGPASLVSVAPRASETEPPS
jgi:hypothetical protein